MGWASLPRAAATEAAHAASPTISHGKTRLSIPALEHNR